MDPLLSRTFFARLPALTSQQLQPFFSARRVTASPSISNADITTSRRPYRRAFSSTRLALLREKKPPFEADTLSGGSSHTQPATNLSQNVSSAEKSHFDRVEEESEYKQARSPWMREGSDEKPVTKMRSAGAMIKGKLLTTPSRMLKLILPLTTRDTNNDRKDVEPLALLVHPQQPLSYLERLIQSELSYLNDGTKERVPSVSFRAQDSTEEDIMSGTPAVDEMDEESGAQEKDDILDAEVEQGNKTGKIKNEQDDQVDTKRHSEGTSQREDPEHPNFVRWSPSTEIGDFIRDAARGKEFAVDVEGAPSIYVGVPSFADRTYYLRMRLRKTSHRILELADLKQECDNLAHRGAQRVARGGFLALVAYWGGVYYATFKSDLGWDVMEPVTYLIGLSGLIGGYMWFLYHNREVSYKSAMNFTVSRRQSHFYEQKGFNLSLWEGLVEEGNRLRREIKMVADEYDVEWDERQDEKDEKVSKALRQERKKRNGGKEEGEEEEEEDDDDDEDEDKEKKGGGGKKKKNRLR